MLPLRFADGATRDVDVLERMRGRVFQNARSENGFAQARLDPERAEQNFAGIAALDDPGGKARPLVLAEPAAKRARGCGAPAAPLAR